MNYYTNPKNGDKISILGYGGMRFPLKNGKIDYAETEKLLLRAVELGVNYFDTAYFYHDGESEGVVGRIFESNKLRKNIKIATKLPIYRVKKAADFDTFLSEQLSRLKTDYIDYYLLHSVMGLSQYEKLKAMGVLKWAEKQKQSGKIKNIGYSYHGTKEDFLKIIEDYPWDFVQIQYNYLDENFQAGKTGYLRAKELGIPVVIMEPLQGGNITDKLPETVKQYWAECAKDRTLADIGLRWVWNHDGVMLLLSGMTLMDHLTENCKTASIAGPNTLSQEELACYDTARKKLSELEKIPCTACEYCVPHCQKHINIPACFSSYNRKFAAKGSNGKFFYKIKQRVKPYINYMTDTGSATQKKPPLASSCIACRACEKHCPQGIKISDELKRVTKELENPLFSIIRFGGRIVLK